MAVSVSPVRRLLDRLFDRELDDRRGPAGVCVRTLRIVYLGSREFRRDFCWERAATLAFSTAISLLPIAVLFLSVLKLGDLKNFVNDTVIPYLIPGLELQEDFKALLGQLFTADEELDDLGAGTGIAAIFGLVVAGLALLVSAERIFSRLWKVRSTRNYFQKFVAFWLILTTSPLLIGLSIYVKRELGSSFVVTQPALRTLYQLFLPVLISCMAFSLLYLFLPHTRVRILSAMAGGCVAGILWEVLKWGFIYYVERVKGASPIFRFYGSLGMVPFFLLFVYLTWLVILAGSELSYAVQHYRGLVRDFRLRRHGEESGRYSPVYLGLFLLGRIVEAFQGGKRSPELEEVAEAVDAYAEEFRPVVESLVEVGVLVENAAEPGRYLPARAPETIPLKPVVEGLLALGNREEGELAARGGAEGRTGGVTRFLSAREAFVEEFADLSLEELSGEEVPKLARDGVVAKEASTAEER